MSITTRFMAKRFPFVKFACTTLRSTSLNRHKIFKFSKVSCHFHSLASLPPINFGGSYVVTHYRKLANEIRDRRICHCTVGFWVGRVGARRRRRRVGRQYQDCDTHQARHHHCRRKSQLRSSIRNLRAQAQGGERTQSPVREDHQRRRDAGAELLGGASVPDYLRTQWREILQQRGSE